MSAKPSEKRFPIGAWVAPPPRWNGMESRITKERYAEIAACGINCIYALYDVLPEYAQEVEDALLYSEQVGIGYLARFTDLIKMPAGERVEWVRRLEQYAAFRGILVQDEPGIEQFPALGRLRREMASEGFKEEFYINLLPMYASHAQLRYGASPGRREAEPVAYRDYLAAYCREVEPDFLSLDYYPFQEPDGFLTDYFLQLELVREAAQAQGVPFRVFVQITAWGDSVPRMTPAHVAWQVNTALASGAKGIQYFTYWTPMPSDSLECFASDSGLVSLAGERQPLYAAVAKLNRQVAACGEFLQDCTFAGIAVCGNTPAPLRRDVTQAFGPLSAVRGGDAVCGCFASCDGERYYLANNSWERTARIGLEFVPGTDLFLVRDGTRVPASGRIEAVLEPGEGMLIGVKRV